MAYDKWNVVDDPGLERRAREWASPTLVDM